MKYEKELFDRANMVKRAQHTQGPMDARYRTLNDKTGLNKASTSTRALYAIRIIPNIPEILTID